jgi:hypothetical protein
MLRHGADNRDENSAPGRSESTSAIMMKSEGDMSTNPALADLRPLVGRWRMELYNAAFLPDAESRVTGSTEIDWIEDGSALRMRQGDSQHPPAAVWIIGRDEAQAGYSVLYSDDRGVSRIYRMSLEGADWRMWRDTPEFSQHFQARLDPDSGEIQGHWERSTDQGATWEHDFNVDYILEPA